MKTQGHATFGITAWDETPYLEMDNGTKLTRVHGGYAFKGDLEGQTTSDSLMVYNSNGTGSAVGLERVVGAVGGKKGSFVMQHTASFDSNGSQIVVTDNWSVVPGSATHELRGLRAEGQIIMVGSGSHEGFTTDFTYEFVDEPVSAASSDKNA